jgi:hypothetical protein
MRSRRSKAVKGTTVPPAVSPEDAPTPAAEFKIIREKDRPPSSTPAAELTDSGDAPVGEVLPPPGPDARLELSVTKWGSFISRVPADQAHHLITTFGIVVSGIAGITGAVQTFHATHDALPAYAELALALIAAVLVAVCGQMEIKKKRGRA